MTSAPSGQRLWKCPECGSEVTLSVVQLDPIACDACLQKLKGKESSKADHSTSVHGTGPLGIWSSLPETTKLGIVVAALLVGLVIGFKLGSDASPGQAHKSASHSKSSPVEEPDSHEDPMTDSETDERPDPPGPGYKWVKGRKHKDGTIGKGHWAKDPRASDSK